MEVTNGVVRDLLKTSSIKPRCPDLVVTAPVGGERDSRVRTGWHRHGGTMSVDRCDEDPRASDGLAARVRDPLTVGGDGRGGFGLIVRIREVSRDPPARCSDAPKGRSVGLTGSVVEDDGVLPENYPCDREISAEIRWVGKGEDADPDITTGQDSGVRAVMVRSGKVDRDVA